MSNQQDGSLASVIDAKLVELEHEADAITLEEVYSRYRDYGWDVFERRTGEGGAFTAANDNLTEKGLRHFLALLDLEEFAFSDDDGGEQRREPVLSPHSEATAEIDPGLSH